MNKFRFLTGMTAVLALGIVSQVNAAEKNESVEKKSDEKTAHTNGVFYMPYGNNVAPVAYPGYGYNPQQIPMQTRYYYQQPTMIPQRIAPTSRCTPVGCYRTTPTRMYNYNAYRYPVNTPMYQNQGWSNWNSAAPMGVPPVQYIPVPTPTTNSNQFPQTRPISGGQPYLAGTPQTLPVSNPYFP